MRPARLILILVALVAGGLAFFLATRGGPTAPANPQVVTEVVAEKKTQVLVAKAPIGVGQRLNTTLVEWQDWPEGALRSEYITIATSPNAATDISGAVARFEFFAGEPIREQKLVRSDQGYLSAVLPAGMRGVSIGVSAESGAGGFIVPNDRVDVILTRVTDAGQVSQPILTNVKVLAIGKRLGQVGTPAGQEEGDAAASTATFDGDTIATLELDPGQADTIINAGAIGRLSLTLRSIADFRPDPNSVAAQARPNQTIRVIRYGKDATTFATQSAPSAPAPVNPVSVDPAGYQADPAPAATPPAMQVQ